MGGKMLAFMHEVWGASVFTHHRTIAKALSPWFVCSRIFFGRWSSRHMNASSSCFEPGAQAPGVNILSSSPTFLSRWESLSGTKEQKIVTFYIRGLRERGYPGILQRSANTFLHAGLRVCFNPGEDWAEHIDILPDQFFLPHRDAAGT